MSSMKTFDVHTDQRVQMVDITRPIQALIKEFGVSSGLCVVYSPHTTAGITINENADPDVQADIIKHLAKIVPVNAGFAHTEGNSDSHIKAAMMGFSQTIPVEGGRLVLGTWQAVYFAEFDGPRSRKVHVKIISD